MILHVVGNYLNAVGREDLIDLLLGVSLADTFLLSNDLGELVSVAGCALEIFWGKLWVLGSESGSCFVETHIVYEVVMSLGVISSCMDRGGIADLTVLVCGVSVLNKKRKSFRSALARCYIDRLLPLTAHPTSSCGTNWNCFCSHRYPSRFCPTINTVREWEGVYHGQPVERARP